MVDQADWAYTDCKCPVMTLMRLGNAGQIDLTALVEETHSPAEAAEVFGRLATESSFQVVQFDWSMLEKE